MYAQSKYKYYVGQDVAVQLVDFPVVYVTAGVHGEAFYVLTVRNLVSTTVTDPFRMIIFTLFSLFGVCLGPQRGAICMSRGATTFFNPVRNNPL